MPDATDCFGEPSSCTMPHLKRRHSFKTAQFSYARACVHPFRLTQTHGCPVGLWTPNNRNYPQSALSGLQSEHVKLIFAASAESKAPSLSPWISECLGTFDERVRKRGTSASNTPPYGSPLRGLGHDHVPTQFFERFWKWGSS